MKKMADPYSVCALPLQMFSGEIALGTATGFFWGQAGRIYLFSNWHVFSGRNPRSGQPLDQQTYLIPDTIKFNCHIQQNLTAFMSVTIGLTSPDGNILWIQHSVHGQSVDIAAIDITNDFLQAKRELQSDFDLFCINEAPRVNDMAALVGADVFVLGFPKGIMKNGIFPIWKRASIATEHDFDVDGLPCFLIDTATREGMSGAPVIIRSFGGYTDKQGNSNFGLGACNEFLGVYSGRHIGGIDEAHLGIVWKKSLVEEIIAGPAKGDYEIRS